ncbi:MULTISPECIES: hypothetical protein [unclassified Pseudomonas]|uniref:hypothetical protein n=1 Tax=unclassified Pseudomonas TaxID=196821 RepID=UPI0011302C15|nr:MULTISPECIES: hypothetical protein [unclassified Pseudomonas]
MALSSCHCPSCLAVVANSGAAIRGGRYVAMFRRNPEHGAGFESVEISAEIIGDATKAAGRIWAARDGLYSPKGILVKLERVEGQPCKRVWAAEFDMGWRQVDIGNAADHHHG